MSEKVEENDTDQIDVDGGQIDVNAQQIDTDATELYTISPHKSLLSTNSNIEG